MIQVSAPTLLQALSTAPAMPASSASGVAGNAQDTAENEGNFAQILDLSALAQAPLEGTAQALATPLDARVAALTQSKDGKGGNQTGKILPVAGNALEPAPADRSGSRVALAQAEADSGPQAQTEAELALASLPAIPDLPFLPPFAEAMAPQSREEQTRSSAATLPLGSAASPITIAAANVMHASARTALPQALTATLPASATPDTARPVSEAVAGLRLAPVTLVPVETPGAEAAPLASVQRPAVDTALAIATAAPLAKAPAQAGQPGASATQPGTLAANVPAAPMSSASPEPSAAVPSDRVPAPRVNEPAMRRSQAVTGETVVQPSLLAPAGPLQPTGMADTAAAPAINEPVEGPQDFATLVSRLTEAREAANPQLVRTALTHAQFGQVSLQFRHDDGGLAVTMASADPDFTGIVQSAAVTAAAAGAQAQADTPRDGQQAQHQSQQHNTTAQPSSQQAGAGASNTGGQGGSQPGAQARADDGSQRGGNAASPRPSPGSDADGTSRAPTRGGGIYA